MNSSGTSKTHPARIAIEAQALRPPMSGVGRAVHELIAHLPAQATDHRFTVYHPLGAPVPRERAGEHMSFRPSLLPTRLRPVRLLWQQAVLPLTLRWTRAEVLHATSYTAPLLTNVPVVLTIYDTIALQFPQWCKRLNALHFRLVMRRNAARAARIIVPSEATRADVVRDLGVPPEKIRMIPLGVSEAFRPVEDPAELRRAREELGLPTRYILFTGNLEPKKNLPALIDAFSESHLTGRYTHRLVIAGMKGWRCSDVFAAVRRNRMADIVQFLGRVPSRLLPALYSGASVFVMPSLYEGFGLPPLEAMACGAPVVTTTAGALPEVVGDAALTVPPNDTRLLRMAIEKVLTNQYLARKLGELGRQRAKKFSWNTTARKTIEVYDEVIAEGEAGR